MQIKFNGFYIHIYFRFIFSILVVVQRINQRFEWCSMFKDSLDGLWSLTTSDAWRLHWSLSFCNDSMLLLISKIFVNILHDFLSKRHCHLCNTLQSTLSIPSNITRAMVLHSAINWMNSPLDIIDIRNKNDSKWKKSRRE